MTLINATELLEDLETAEADFDNTMNESIKNQPTDQPTIGKVRPELTEALTDLYSMVWLLNKGTSSEDLKELQNSLNELIVLSLATVKAAITRSKNKKNKGKGNNTDVPSNNNPIDQNNPEGEPADNQMLT